MANHLYKVRFDNHLSIVDINETNQSVIRRIRTSFKEYNQFNISEVEEILEKSSKAQILWREKDIKDRINIISTGAHLFL